MTDETLNIQLVDKTHPKALQDYVCSAGDDGHIIKKGDGYVRVVYKMDGKFAMQHWCFECWFRVKDEEKKDEPTV